MSDLIALANLDDAPVSVEAVHHLRSARRANRIADIEWFELAYRAYLAALVGGFAVLGLAGAIGDSRLPDASIARAVRHGPAVVGVAAALAIAMGFRSGSRGGPLALEPAEVRHVLLAPVERRAALVGSALKVLRYSVFCGAVVGAIAGLLVSRRLGGSRLSWIASGGGAGIVAAASFIAAALVASGWRLHRILANIVSLVLVAGAASALAFHHWWPTTLVGDMAMWPARHAPTSLIALAVVGVAVAVGLRRLGHLELEAAERRTELAGQLRFAVTARDLRTAIVVHRMLAQDRPRTRPLFAMPGARIVWRRSWQGLARLPFGRLARMVALGIGAGLAVLGAFRGTSPLAIVAGLAMFVVGLDALEPLAQEIDQLDRAAMSPHDRSTVMVRHLFPPAIVVTLVAAIGWLAQLVVAVAGNRSGRGVELAVGALGIVTVALTGLAGAAMSLIMGAPDPLGTDSLLGANDVLMPEVAGMRMVARTVGPLIVAVSGALGPVLAHRLQTKNISAMTGSAMGTFLGASMFACIVSWTRFRDQARAYMMRSAADARARSRSATST